MIMILCHKALNLTSKTSTIILILILIGLLFWLINLQNEHEIWGMERDHAWV